MFMKSFGYVLIVISLMSMSEAFARKPERPEGLEDLNRIFRTFLRNESKEDAIQSKRGGQKRHFHTRRFSPPKAADKAGIRPRVSAQRKAHPPLKKAEPAKKGVRVHPGHNRKAQEQTVGRGRRNKKVTQRKTHPPLKRAEPAKRGVRVHPGHNRKAQEQTGRRGRENKKVIQINQKNRPVLPLNSSPTISSRKPGQEGTVKVSELPPAEKARIQKTLGALHDKGTVTYRYPATVDGVSLIENIEYTGPASKKGYDKRQFSSYEGPLSRGSYASEIYESRKSHKRSSHTKIRLGRKR
ncbi:MAG: hypothetical protein K2W92_03725 [Alphaproteobacteria bacterium]|nr:hypothetical protein [Alphaproteobacteria bacterium]